MQWFKDGHYDILVRSASAMDRPAVSTVGSVTNRLGLSRRHVNLVGLDPKYIDTVTSMGL